MQWVLMGPHPMGSPFDNGFVCIVRPFAPLKNGPPLVVPWVTMGGPTHEWVGPPISSTHSNPIYRESQKLLSVAENRRHKARLARPQSTPISESVKCRFIKCRFSAELYKLEKIFKIGGSVEKQIQKALGSLPPFGNRCRLSESAICSSRVHPPSEIKSNFKFKALRWRLLRWRLTLSTPIQSTFARGWVDRMLTLVASSCIKVPDDLVLFECPGEIRNHKLEKCFRCEPSLAIQVAAYRRRHCGGLSWPLAYAAPN